MKIQSTIEVLDNGLDSALDTLISNTQAKYLLITSPYITDAGANAIINRINKRAEDAPRMRLAIVTRFKLMDFVTGASTIEAIERLYEAAQNECKGKLISSDILDLPELHAKLFLTNLQAIVGSANLTSHGLHCGNIEICLNIFEPATLSALKATYKDLTKHTNEINSAFLKTIKNQCNEMKKEREAYKSLCRKIEDFQIKSQLCRLPIVTGSKRVKANYYLQMVDYLKWIKTNDGEKLTSALVNKIAGNLEKDDKNDKRLAHTRVNFLEAIRLIRYLKKRKKVCLTPLGEKVASSPMGQRKTVFEHILKWSENEHHDRRLRNVLYVINDCESIDKNSLLKKLGPDKTTINTCVERNWLDSLGVIKHEGNRSRYMRGDLFPKGRDKIEDRLNSIVSSKDNLQWLK